MVMETLKPLSEEKQLFQAIFDDSFEPIIITNQKKIIVEINSAACNLLGHTRDELLNRPLIKIFPTSLADSRKRKGEVEIKQKSGEIRTVAFRRGTIKLPHYKLLFLKDLTQSRQAANELYQQNQRVTLFSEVTLKISQALQLQEILKTAVNEVQQILQADRVLIYQILNDGTGITISEAVLPDYDPILQIQFPAEVFPEDYQARYAAGRVQAIADVHRQQEGLAECLIEFLDELRVKAKLVVPIIQNFKPKIPEEPEVNQLWGLLIAHQCRSIREWKTSEIELMQQLAAQIGIALSQAELRENLEVLVEERTARLREANLNLQQEIKDRQQAEAALRRSEEKLRLIANGLPALIAYVDKKKRYRFNNHAYEQWLGLVPNEIYGKHLRNVHGKEVYENIKQYVEQVLAGEKVTYEEEIVFADGSLHTVNVTCIPHIDESRPKTVKGFFALTSDITERKAIERMKDEFISIVSHELRTPLTSIHSSLKILATGKLGNLSTKGCRMLDIADEQTDRLVRLVNNVLDLQSIQSRKVKIHKRACSVNELVREASQTMQTMAYEHGVELNSKPVPHQVWANHDYIVQTLTNLLSNAIKFSPPESQVWLLAKTILKTEKNHSKKDDRYLIFEIKDQGQGIPANQLETIFERFQQVDSSDARKKGGTGLGLAICRQIIEEHRGKIWAESCLGKGSSFYFTLPLFIQEEEK